MTRNHVWYVTIDDQDNCRADYNRHRRNLPRLQSIAESIGIRVEPIWMPNLHDDLLNDDNLLALFGSGSFGEWFNYASNPLWAAQLDRYCEQIRTTRVPMLTVCGTHQLVVRAFGDWGAIGHMAAMGQNVASIADEMCKQRSLIPQPRLGEVGDFPLQICPEQSNDPLFEGLPDQLWFVQSHCDQAISGRQPAFVNLLKPALDQAPLFYRPDEAAQEGRLGHRNPQHPSERCQVQALRLATTERVLYSTGFHPEMPAWVDSSIDWQSERLLLNFFQIARGYWQRRDILLPTSHLPR